MSLPVRMMPRAAESPLTDEDVVARVRGGDAPLFEVIMRRYNQRLYRVSRAIVGNDAEAEDVMQEAYVRAYTHLDQFAGRARFSTWLTKIAVYEAMARARKRGRMVEIDALPEQEQDTMVMANPPKATQEDDLLAKETRYVLETAVDELPAEYRSVLVLRDVEGMSTAETAEALGLSLEAVKTRLHRAHAMLRKRLFVRFGATASEAFAFQAPRCDRVVAAVFARIL